MVFSIVTYVLALVGLVGIYAVVGGALDRIGRAPTQVESSGPFDLVTEDVGSWDSYSIRYRDRPFSIVGASGVAAEGEVGSPAGARAYSRPNALVSFPSDPPAFIAHVGDPNNTGSYYLVHEVEGEPRADFLTESRGGVSVDWLDDPNGGTGTRDLTVHRKRLRGGRFLLVGESCVVDTRTLDVHRFDLTLPNYSFHPFKGPLGLSPDGRSFVRLASGPGDAIHLVVVRFTDGTAYALPVDRPTMRFELPESLDAAWVLHHFEWRRDENGVDRLTGREAFVPLPYRGRLTQEKTGGYREYRLPPSAPVLLDTLLAFVGREFDAEEDPDSGGGGAAGFRIDGGVVQIAYYTDCVTVFSSRDGNSRPVLAIARRFDEELATGRWDALFARSEELD